MTPGIGCTAPADPSAWAYVAFTGKTDLWWLRILKPGFRHCFVVLNDGRHWITVDPLANALDVAVQPVPPETDLPAWYCAQGLSVVPARRRASLPRPMPIAPVTCVEVVKRTIGLRDRWIVTPFQLYRALCRDWHRRLGDAVSIGALPHH